MRRSGAVLCGVVVRVRRECMEGGREGGREEWMV